MLIWIYTPSVTWELVFSLDWVLSRLFLLLSMLIAWTPMSSSVISGVQGRYFLPFLPALLLICKNDRLILTKDINRSILYFMLVLNSYVLFRTFAAVVLRV